jgi:hypothetical protein
MERAKRRREEGQLGQNSESGRRYNDDATPEPEAVN